MNLSIMPKLLLVIGTGFLAAFAVRHLWKLKNKEARKMDTEFTGAAPRYSGAISAVTGGPPEDMNEMPAAEEPKAEGPVYDGSDLKRSRG